MSLKCEWTAAESFSVLEGINFSQLGKNLVRPMAKKAIKWRDFHLSILSIFLHMARWNLSLCNFTGWALMTVSTFDSFHVRGQLCTPLQQKDSLKPFVFDFLFVSSRTENYMKQEMEIGKKIPTLNETKLVSLVRGLEQLNRCRFRFKTHFVYYNLSLKAIMKVQIQVYGSQRCQKCSAC